MRSGPRMLGVASRGNDQKAGTCYEDIAAIGITNQRENDDRLGQKDGRAGLSMQSYGSAAEHRNTATP